MNVQDLSMMLGEIHYEAERQGRAEPDYRRTWDELSDHLRGIQAIRWQWVAERLLPKLAGRGVTIGNIHLPAAADEIAWAAAMAAR